MTRLPAPHRPAAPARPRQRGAFLLEALVSVLIVALGILGLVGLFARSVQNVDETKFRAEAAHLAASLIGQMWVSNRANHFADFDSSAGGVGYTEFKAFVNQRLPGASLPGNDPIVNVTAGPVASSTDVEIRLYWQPPGSAGRHEHWATATVGRN